jgi:hypothetical protein
MSMVVIKNCTFGVKKIQEHWWLRILTCDFFAMSIVDTLTPFPLRTITNTVRSGGKNLSIGRTSQ